MNYVEQIQHQAEQIFGNKEKADAWLNQPKKALRDRAPLELARDEEGYLLVRDELERIHHGYSA
jgi:putative toxin-antitoxin system antitoxin component (TIGR02293 family)